MSKQGEDQQKDPEKEKGGKKGEDVRGGGQMSESQELEETKSRIKSTERHINAMAEKHQPVNDMYATLNLLMQRQRQLECQLQQRDIVNGCFASELDEKAFAIAAAGGGVNIRPGKDEPVVYDRARKEKNMDGVVIEGYEHCSERNRR